MRELYVVPLPKTRYKAWDYFHSIYTPYFDTITEVCEYLNLSIHYNLKDQIDTVFDPHRYRYDHRHYFSLYNGEYSKKAWNNPPDLRRYVFFNDWDGIINPDDVVAAAPIRYRHHRRESDLRIYVPFTKANPNQYKKKFRQVKEYSSRAWSNYEYIDQPGIRQFRRIHTTAERRQNIAHVDEYGAEMVRGRRRKLPSAWDDFQSSAWYDMTSWKRNSKRPKQWKIRG